VFKRFQCELSNASEAFAGTIHIVTDVPTAAYSEARGVDSGCHAAWPSGLWALESLSQGRDA
jgi:hypothetical protein